MKFAIFDYDETLSKGMILPELLFHAEKEGVIRKGVTKEYNDIWDKYKAYSITYDDFVNGTTKVVLDYIADCKVLDFIKCVKESDVIENKLNPWVKDLLKMLHDKDYLTIIVSATPIEVLDVIQEKIDIDSFFGTIITVKNGKYTNEVKNLVNNSEKSKIVEKLVKEVDYTIGMGDSEGDIDMLRLMDKPFLYEPFKDTEDEAKKYNIPVINSKNVIKEFSKVLL